MRLADQAFALGGQTAQQSYLNTDAVLQAIQRSGADAVHPGYGFFSESADFARSVTESGVTFIGPGPEAIEIMGDKISSRHAAARVGVAGVAGTSEAVLSPEEITAFGEDHGWPVAIKAAYGGGGRGMRILQGPDGAAEALSSAKREAAASFGRDECYLERYLPRPRHVEVQILADTFGNCVHLGTRDCSAQRRHQKLIEEAPAAGIRADVVADMGSAAVAVAQGCGYLNAGTVEFLYSEGAFFFLEMNTRLQVEHPATELVTGIDLVEQQLRIAAGEALMFRQDDITLNGHAIEVRINAEDPAGGTFLPSPGRITTLKAPDGFGTRFDTGYETGDNISRFYDNLIGKLIVWGRDRDRAINRAIRALEEFRIQGVATTIPADLAILAHQDFQTLSHSTKWVEESLDLSGIGSTEPALSDESEPRVKRELDVEVNGKRFSVSMWVPEAEPTHATAAAPTRGRRSRPRVGGDAGSGDVVAPMQGTIVKVAVAVGSTVATGDLIVVLEAMKMENNLTAQKAGTITEIRVIEGDSVGGGDILAVIE